MKERFVLAGVVGLLACSPALATNVVWDDGAAGDTFWSSASNWDPDGVPADGADVEFASAGTTAKIGNDGFFLDRTIGTITFNAAGGFALGFQNAWWANYHITNAVIVAAAADYTIQGSGAVIMGGNTTWDVMSGASVTVDNLQPSGYTLEKKGAGQLRFYQPWGGGSAGILKVSEGTVSLTGGSAWEYSFSSISGTGALNRGGAAGYVYLDLNQGTNDYEWGGVISDSVQIIKNGRGTFKVAGAGTVGQLFIQDGGTVALDNTAQAMDNRWYGGLSLRDSSALKLVGSSSADVAENIAAGGGWNSFFADRGFNTLEVQHGAGHKATLTAGNQVLNGNIDYIPVNGGMLKFVGNDLGGTGAAASLIKFNEYWHGSGFLQNGILGGWTRVGDEFATYDATYGVSALPAGHASRVNQAEGANGTKNVLANVAQNALTADTTIMSLKIDGTYPLNLGGYTLTIPRGGLIQTGANNPGGITNGTLKCFTTDLIDNWICPANVYIPLYVQNETDLRIGATVLARFISKCGAGKLTLDGDLQLQSSPDINWYEGSLELNSSANFVCQAQVNGSGDLIKDGTGRFEIKNKNYSTGMMTVKNGTLKIATGSSGNLSGGPCEVDNPGKLWIDGNLTATNSFKGTGTIMMNSLEAGGGTAFTLTSKGGTCQPGTSAGVLTVTGNLAWTLNAATPATLDIEITGNGAVAGTDYDQLAVSGTVSGLNATPSSAVVDLVVRAANGLGSSPHTYTIVNAPAQDFSGTSFRNVTWFPEGTTGTVNYLNGSITLTNVKVPVPGTVLFVR